MWTGYEVRQPRPNLALLFAVAHQHRAVLILAGAHLDTVFAPLKRRLVHGLAGTADNLAACIFPALVAGREDCRTDIHRVGSTLDFRAMTVLHPADHKRFFRSRSGGCRGRCYPGYGRSRAAGCKDKHARERGHEKDKGNRFHVGFLTGITPAKSH